LKKFAAILVGLVIVAVVAVLIGPSFVDWNSYKPEITAAVEERTGRKLTIGGAIDLQILPSPRLSVADVQLSNADGATDPDMVRLDSLQVHVALRPLLSGAVQISSVTLIRPVISLERQGDGSLNWQFGALGGSNGADAGAGGSRPAGAGVAVSLDGAEIIDGSIIFRDAGTDRAHRIEDLDATIIATSLDGPFSATGGLIYRGLKTEFAANLGQIDPGKATVMKLTVELPKTGGGASFEGTLNIDNGPSLQGKLAMNAKDLGGLARTLSEAGVVEATVPPVFSKPLDVTATIAASPAGGEISDLVVQLGKARVQGSLSASLAETVSMDAKFALGRLDLDDFGVFAGGSSSVPSSTDGSSSDEAPAKAPTFTLPENMRVKVAISADALDHGGRTVRQVRVEGVLDQGAVSLDVLTAQLPGGTNLTVNGTVYADGGLPRFIGRADVVSDNLRTALQWLDVPLDGLAADRLRKGVFGADIDASPEQVELTNWAVDIDNTRIGGGLSLLIRDRPAFGLSLDIGKINLDAYLPDSAKGGATSSQNAATATSDQSNGDQVTKLLSSFDANLLISVEEARYRNTIIRNGALDATIQSGQVVIRDLSIKDVGGAAISAEGTLAGTVTAPNSDVNIMVTAKSAARLARLAGMDVTETIQKLGGFKFQSKIQGSLEALTIDSVLRIAGGRLDTKGVVEPLASPLGLDLALKFSHPKTEKFLTLFDESFAARDIALGGGTLTASVLTQPDRGMAIDATLNVAASRLTAKGGIQLFAVEPMVEARVTFDHPDIVKLIRFAAPAFKPSRRDLGATSIGFSMAGTADAIKFTNLSLKAGPTLFRGDGGAILGGPRPKISVRLATDALDVDPWLPLDAAKPTGVVAAVPARANGREWSRDRIDLDGLRAVDADLDLSAKKVTYSSYVIDDFALKAELQGGKLTARQFGGGLFGGRVEGAGRLVAIDTPSADFSLKIENADLREVALATADKARVSGVFDYETQLSSRGYSEFDMVSALQGSGQFKVRDGSVEGIDLPAISEQLKKLDRALDFLVLARKAMNGGASPIDQLSGSYTIDDGVLRSDNITLSSKTAAGKTTAVVNLPPQEMDVRSRFWLSEHQNSPPIQVRHVGPLANPRTILDVEKLQAYVLQRVVQRGILRQFDGGAKSPTAPAATTESSEVEKPAELPSLDKIKPRDALRGILKGLLN
jgi:uncharacterized protein involved in outer membrane biogenesis